MRLILAAAAAFLASATALAAPTQLRLSVMGDPRTTMGVAWTTAEPADSVVEVRLVGTTTPVTQHRDAAGEEVAGIGFIHGVTVTGLQAGRAYDYRVGDGATWSDWAAFRTSGEACEPWSFVALGDERADPIINAGRGVSTRWGPILQEAAATQPGVIVNSGDMVYDGSVTDQWVDWLTTSEPVTSEIPQMPVLGNHDHKGEDNQTNFNGIFHLPHNDEEDSSSYFSFRWGNALFVGLNSAGNRGGTEADPRPYARQAAWMRRVLEANHDATWRVVVLHHPLFTAGGQSLFGIELGHPPNEYDQNPVLLPLLDEFNVDFVLAGHNHWYERYEAVTQSDDPTKGVPAGEPHLGTQHIVTGGAGAVTLDIGLGDFNVINIICGNTQPGMVACLGDHHYVRFEVHGRSITVTTVATVCQNANCDGQSRVIETWSYTKPGPDPCAAPPASSSSSAAASSSSSARSSSAAASSSSSAGSASSSAAPVHSSSKDPGSSSAAGPSSSSAAAAASSSGSGGGDDGAPSSGGCGCATSSPGSLLLLAFGLLALRPRRRP